MLAVGLGTSTLPVNVTGREARAASVATGRLRQKPIRKRVMLSTVAVGAVQETPLLLVRMAAARSVEAPAVVAVVESTAAITHSTVEPEGPLVL